MRSGAAAAAAQVVAGQAQRVGHFKGFDGRVERVTHVDVCAAEAVALRMGAHTPAERLVVGPRRAVGVFTPHCTVIHGALAGGGDAVGQGLRERAEHGIGDALGGLYVAAGYGSGRAGVDETAGRRVDLDGCEAAGVDGYVLADEAADDVVAGGPRYA